MLILINQSIKCKCITFGILKSINYKQDVKYITNDKFYLPQLFSPQNKFKCL